MPHTHASAPVPRILTTAKGHARVEGATGAQPFSAMGYGIPGGVGRGQQRAEGATRAQPLSAVGYGILGGVSAMGYGIPGGVG